VYLVSVFWSRPIPEDDQIRLDSVKDASGKGRMYTSSLLSKISLCRLVPGVGTGAVVRVLLFVVVVVVVVPCAGAAAKKAEQMSIMTCRCKLLYYVVWVVARPCRPQFCPNRTGLL